MSMADQTPVQNGGPVLDIARARPFCRRKT
jgi:hypothetical protein